MLNITKTELAKGVVSTAIALSAAKQMDRQLTNRTNVNVDSIPVMLATTVAGQLIANQLAPLTDHLVDLAINRVQTWKKNKQDTTE